MHTERYETEYADMSVTHNSDWSGMARIQWEYYPPHTDDVRSGEVEIPAPLLKELIDQGGRFEHGREIISLIEEWM
jgi:hypothetical protein